MAFILILAIIGLIVLKALDIQQDVVRSEEHRYRSFLLAMELFQSSEDLTRMARSYVSTGDPAYEKRYFDILDIRNGIKPRPIKYSPTYWHLAGVDRGPAIAHGEAVPLQDLMRREGLTEQELALLRESQANSDHLVLMEKRAFAAITGLYEDGQGRFTVRKAPSQDYAIGLLFSKEYFDEKARIMEPIQRFMDAQDVRIKTELNAHVSRLRRYIIWALVLIAMALIGLAVSVVYSFRWILRPIERMRSQVTQIAEGNYAARCTILSVNEIGELCRHFNHMADSLETDIHRRKEAAEILKENETQMRLVLNASGGAIYGTDMEGNCTFANLACARAFGYTNPEAILGGNMHRLTHHSYPDGRPMPIEECVLNKACREGLSLHAEDVVFWKPDGAKFHAEYWSYPQIAEGRVYGAVVTFIDITERKKAQELLTEETKRLSDILEGTNLGTWQWNTVTGEIIFNERMAEILGYRLSELVPITRDMRERFIHPDDLKTSSDVLERYLKNELKYYECELRMHHKSGSWIWVLEKGQVVTWTPDGKPLIVSGTQEDITERKREEERIRYLATHDALTDLPNMRMARERLAIAIGMARRHKTWVAVMFIDLDGFKHVNDTFGHDAGDDVLREAAGRFRSRLRETDTAARVGGDEFLLVITDLNSPDNAATLAEALIGLFSRPIHLKHGHVSIGLSIGIALYPGDGDDIDRLIKTADQAMYRVKSSGKNGFAFARPAS